MQQQNQSISLKADVEGFDTLIDLALSLRWALGQAEGEFWGAARPEIMRADAQPLARLAHRSAFKDQIADGQHLPPDGQSYTVPDESEGMKFLIDKK